MFQKHSILHTKTNSINYLIVDVNHKKGKIAYYDLNKQPHQRKSRSELPNKSAVRPTRIQNKPENMFLD